MKGKTAAVTMKNITKKFGPVVASDKVNLEIYKGEILALLGENGSGKTTLMNMLSGIYFPDEGQIFINGKETVIRSPKDAYACGIGMVHQHFKLIDVLTAAENIMLAPMTVLGMNRTDARTLADNLLAKVRINERADHFPDELSGGQQQRVAIARALAVKPKMMLFDEPTSALDPELRHEVLKVMQDLAEEGMTMVIVTHEIGFAEKVASRLIFIDKGRIAEDGDPQVLVKNPPSPRLREFLQHVA